MTVGYLFPAWEYFIPNVGSFHSQCGNNLSASRLLSNKCRVLNDKGTLLENNPRLFENRWHLLQDLMSFSENSLYKGVSNDLGGLKR